MPDALERMYMYFEPTDLAELAEIERSTELAETERSTELAEAQRMPFSTKAWKSEFDHVR